MAWSKFIKIDRGVHLYFYLFQENIEISIVFWERNAVVMNKKISLFVKYLFTLLLPLCSVLFRHMSWNYVVTGMASVLTIAIVTNILCRIRTWIAYVFNSCTLFLINAQYAILFWSNTFVTSVMINNLDSVEALKGKVVQYGITTVLVFLFSFLPIMRQKLRKRHLAGAGAVSLALYGIICFHGMFAQWPNYALYELLSQQIRRYQISAEIKESFNIENMFFRETVVDYVTKPDNLPDSPNVILVFTEGLSQHIVTDERNIMPNAKALSERSIIFENYFNHTFATYMGLSGQLHSGYQENNYDPNYLIGMQDVFSQYGYETAFINTEPNNPEFIKYLQDFEFDELLTDEEYFAQTGNDLTDKDAYRFLLKTAEEMGQRESPFFLAMYTFGTHVSFDSPHEKFGDGKDPFLNRFYNADTWLGEFLDAFESSPLFEDTVFIFTTDHATYYDSDFVRSYPNYDREKTSLDRIPFYIYYRDVEPVTYDVNGRNSLDMAPTVLDLLDMSAENSFLGESLFSPYDNASVYDTFFESSGDVIRTENGIIQGVQGEERQNIEILLAKYFAVKMNDTSMLQEFYNTAHTYAEFDGKTFSVEITTTNAGDWDVLRYAIWSEEDDRDDIQWYLGEPLEDGAEMIRIDLSKHDSSGDYCLHVHGFKDGNSGFVASTSFSIAQEDLSNRHMY